MHHAFRTAVVALSLSALFPTALNAQTPEPPASQIRLARVVDQLGHSSFALRTQAVEELQRLGPEARRSLEQAAQHTNPEIRLQAQRLLHPLRLAEVWSPSLCSGRYHSASKALSDLARQADCRLALGDSGGDFHEAPVDLHFHNTPFWDAAAQTALASGNHLRAAFGSQVDIKSNIETARLAAAAGAMPRVPIAHAGPVLGQIVSVKRCFQEELDLRDARDEQSHVFCLNAEFLWEDRLHLVAFRSRPTVDQAVAFNGLPLAAAEDVDPTWTLVDSGQRLIRVQSRLAPPPVSATAMRCTLGWELIAVSDFRDLTFDDLSPGAVVRGPGISASIERITQHGRIHEITLRIARDLAVPEPPEVQFVENKFTLLDASGRPLVLHGQTDSLTDDGVRLSLRFSPPPSDASDPDSDPDAPHDPDAPSTDDSDYKPAKLRLSYPLLRAQRELQFHFPHVPLPCRRPD